MDQQYMLRLPTGQEFGPATMDMLVSWAREGRVPKDALLVPRDSGDGAFALAPTRVADEPRLASVVFAPPTVGGALITPPQPDNTMGGLIPTKNPPALIGYYMGIFGCLIALLIPVIGIAMPIAALILGVKGLRKFKEHPECRGRTHAMVAIVGGIIGTVFSLIISTAILIAIVAK